MDREDHGPTDLVASAMMVWTIGHSTHTLDAFVALLDAHEIAQVADIRRVPRSRRSPHFDGNALARSLPERGLDYVHLPRLGGWRQLARTLRTAAGKTGRSAPTPTMR